MVDDFMSPTELFNAVEFIFTSHRVACHFPSLVASQAILKFRTPWPRQSYGALRRVQSTRWLTLVTNIPELVIWLVMIMLSLFSATPQEVQFVFLEVVVSEGVGVVVGLHVLLLYRVYPVLVVLPTVLSSGILFLPWYSFWRSSSVVPLETVSQSNGLATSELAIEMEAHIGRRGSIQAGVVLLQDM
jgi:hypothetical protein